MKPSISLVTLGVRDLDRALRFYRDGLGWPLSQLVGDEVAFLEGNNIVLALWSRKLLAEDANLPDDGSGFGGIALAHNAASKEQVDAVLAEAAAAGGTVLRPAVDTSWGGYNGYFADPDGHAWEVAWNPDFPLAADGTVQLPQ